MADDDHTAGGQAPLEQVDEAAELVRARAACLVCPIDDVGCDDEPEALCRPFVALCPAKALHAALRHIALRLKPQVAPNELAGLELSVGEDHAVRNLSRHQPAKAATAAKLQHRRGSQYTTTAHQHAHNERRGRPQREAGLIRQQFAALIDFGAVPKLVVAIADRINLVGYQRNAEVFDCKVSANVVSADPYIGRRARVEVSDAEERHSSSTTRSRSSTRVQSRFCGALYWRRSFSWGRKQALLRKNRG
eukprot:scaffold53405_cov78-Phaeocystis_antarctica.AAC.5